MGKQLVSWLAVRERLSAAPRSPSYSSGADAFVLPRPVNTAQRCVSTARGRAEDRRTTGCPLSVLILPRPPGRYINRAFVCSVSSQCASTIRVQGAAKSPRTQLLLLSLSEVLRETKLKYHSQILGIPTARSLSGGAEAQAEHSGARAELLTGMLCHHHGKINTV